MFNCIRNKSVTIHNLFIIIIQCKVFNNDIWVPLDDLCALEGARDNELCCLVHYTVSNLGQRHSLNPIHWNSLKTSKELGNNFIKAFSHIDSLCEKVTILPMIMVLNKKNPKFLWSNLSWLESFAMDVITDLKNNLVQLLRIDLFLNS